MKPKPPESDKSQTVLPSDPLVERLSARARDLYSGQHLVARTSGVAIAETFGRRVSPYHGLARGGIAGEGECGAIVAGRLVIAEFLAGPDPKGILEGDLGVALRRYQHDIEHRIQGRGSPDYICSSLVAPYDGYDDPARVPFCTAVVAEVARIVAAILLDYKQLEGTAAPPAQE
jgi:hypothetical protein